MLIRFRIIHSIVLFWHKWKWWTAWDRRMHCLKSVWITENYRIVWHHSIANHTANWTSYWCKLPCCNMTVGKQIAICPAMTSHIGNNASHTGNNSHKGNNTIQACLYERNPVLCIICTELLEAFIVGTIDIGWTLPYDTEYTKSCCLLHTKYSPWSGVQVLLWLLSPSLPLAQSLKL